MANKDTYEGLIYQINALLKQWDIYPKYMDSINTGKNDFTISQTYTKKNYDTSWIDTIEDCLVPLDNIVRNPRKFIVVEEDIVDVSLARSISVESVKHLAQHTNLISSVKKDGTIIPSKILNTSKEESFEVYENRFIYTLLLKVRDFIDRRFEAIKSALMQSGDLAVEIKSDFTLDGSKLRYKLDADANFPYEAVVKKKGTGGLTDVERIVRMNSIIGDFLGSAFAKEVRTCALVRPPIQRTNVILKNPDFKAALVLWQYIESNEKMEFNVENVTETAELSPSLSEKYRGLIFLNTVLMQSIANTREAGESLDSALKKEKTEADEYITKNIDDYVPDDFPQLKMELSEIRRIYRKMPFAKTLAQHEITKINAAIDRAVRQVKINKAKEDGLLQQRLIAKQLEEEEKAKKLALRQARDLERRRKQEEARRRLTAKRLEQEREEQLRQLELERQAAEEERKRQEEILRREEEKRAKEIAVLEEIRLEAESYQNKMKAEEEEHRKRVEEERRIIAAERAIFLEQQKQEAEARQQHEYNLAKEEAGRVLALAEGEMKERLIVRHREEKENLRREQKAAIKKLKQEAEENWQREREEATRMLIAKGKESLSITEQLKHQEIAGDERARLSEIALVEKAFSDIIELGHMEVIESILQEARKNRTQEEIDLRIIELHKLYRSRARHIRFDRFKKKLLKEKNGGNKDDSQ